ncbi:E3 ubiquitin-protein ligase TRIM21 isoform X1 [Larimichthys crocea]|uniref:E3 ubiquitin-protein ligase TRIM21 isoform X1 n=1 Tax=Larimichthys crocea TaxID=215358 RepID=UPI000F6026E5|nr:E3 ubiquitin-protein ligase TRIM21 isoform X1 [Larimichthys crocea]
MKSILKLKKKVSSEPKAEESSNTQTHKDVSWRQPEEDCLRTPEDVSWRQPEEDSPSSVNKQSQIGENKKGTTMLTAAPSGCSGKDSTKEKKSILKPKKKVTLQPNMEDSSTIEDRSWRQPEEDYPSSVTNSLNEQSQIGDNEKGTLNAAPSDCSSEKSALKKSIMKPLKKVSILLKMEDSSTTQSSSVGPIRWDRPAEDLDTSSSVPSRKANTSSTNKQSQQHQNSLKDLRSLQECVQFINNWKEQVDQVCKQGGGDDDPKEGNSKREPETTDRRTERSLEESRKLILEWANELRDVDKRLKETPWTESQEQDNRKYKDANEEAQMRIMEWAKELQMATESCGVQSDELAKVLRLLGLKKKRLGNLLPLLEFITWSLLKEDSMTMIPQLWLLEKQKMWKAGIPRYIPSSVWSWICSAEADVLLDPNTQHRWLNLSDDHRQVQEAHKESPLPDSPQRFDTWTCVLGWEGYSSGRHYWEVDIANNGYWRVGVTTGDSKRHGRFPMTPRQGYWTLWRSIHKFYACTNQETELPISLVPRRMGIYLDHEEGQISFYNAETKSHIYTFVGSFRRQKLYPLFVPLDGRTRMTITSPKKVSF